MGPDHRISAFLSKTRWRPLTAARGHPKVPESNAELLVDIMEAVAALEEWVDLSVKDGPYKAEASR